MRATRRYTAALLLFTTFLATTCLLWQPGWSHVTPVEIVVVTAARIAKPFRYLYMPFVLVRLYRKSIGTYQAPLIQWSDEVETQDKYAVKLHPGYSIEDHKNFVGAELLQPRITSEGEMPEFHHVPGYHHYYADLDEAILKAVRADVGVDRVTIESSIIWDVDPVAEDYDEVQHKLDIATVLEELFGPEWEGDLPSMPGLFADLRGIEAP
jgi:hypothetical protein